MNHLISNVVRLAQVARMNRGCPPAMVRSYIAAPKQPLCPFVSLGDTHCMMNPFELCPCSHFPNPDLRCACLSLQMTRSSDHRQQPSPRRVRSTFFLETGFKLSNITFIGDPIHPSLKNNGVFSVGGIAFELETRTTPCEGFCGDSNRWVAFGIVAGRGQSRPHRLGKPSW